MASRYNVRTPITLLDSDYGLQANKNELILNSAEKTLLFKEDETKYNDLYNNFKGHLANTFGAVAGSFDIIGYNWEYEETDQYIILTKYIGTSASVSIPSIANNKIIKVSNTTFSTSPNKTGILSVIFEPGSIVDSMDGMFDGLTSLKVVNNIPESESYVNTFRNTALEYIALPDGVVNAKGAFLGCKNLKETSIPNSIINMDSMYKGCINLLIQNISESAENLNDTFSGCEKLTELINIPASVKSMINTYKGCTNIGGLMVIESDNVVEMAGCFSDTDSDKIKYIFTSSNSTTRKSAEKIDGVNGVKLLHSSSYWKESDWEYEFDGNNCILTKYIGNDKEVVIPSIVNSCAVYVNGVNMFTNNQTVESVRFEDNSIRYYGNTIRYMYRGCKNLMSVPHIDNDITDISYAYFGCESLSDIPPLPESVSNIQFAYAYSNISEAPVIPNLVDSLYFTFAGTKISNFPVIPAHVKNIAYAFSENKEITGDIIIEAKDIPIAAMRNCFLNTPKKKDVYIPYVNSGDTFANTMAAAYHNTFGIFDRDNTIVRYASNVWDGSQWDYTESDDTVTLNTYIGTDSNVVVPGCINNKVVYTNGGLFKDNQTIESVKYEPGSHINNMTDEFFSCTNLKKVENIPCHVTNMTNTFAECRQLETVPELHEGIENITGVCRNCVGLTTLPNVPTTVTHMSYAFYGTENSKGDVYIKSNQISNVQIYRSFAGEAFYSRAVHVPAIGMNATHNTAAAAVNTVYGIDKKNKVTVFADL